jgi:dipeptidyl aminopeptidase/acylaminoacyl peptidase
MRTKPCHLSRLVFIAALAVVFALALSAEIRAQRFNLAKVVELLEKSECTTVAVGKIKICKYDYKFENKAVEAVIVRPAADGKYPSLLLLPGFDRTAADLIPYGVMYAHEGFAALSITPPGFGRSEGRADFVGAHTQKVFVAGWQKFKQESFVDAERMGIYGHSRGGMAASLLAVQLPDAKAAVVASGIYDFRRAFEEIELKGMRDKMTEETGMTDEAVRARSSVLQMASLQIPVLILHGEKDEKTPVSQAYLLRDRLSVLKKDFEIKIFAEAGHLLDAKEVVALTTDFFRRRMKIAARTQK